jgi:hypothetical protein
LAFPVAEVNVTEVSFVVLIGGIENLSVYVHGDILNTIEESKPHIKHTIH